MKKIILDTVAIKRKRYANEFYDLRKETYGALLAATLHLHNSRKVLNKASSGDDYAEIMMMSVKAYLTEIRGKRKRLEEDVVDELRKSRRIVRRGIGRLGGTVKDTQERGFRYVVRLTEDGQELHIVRTRGREEAARCLGAWIYIHAIPPNMNQCLIDGEVEKMKEKEYLPSAGEDDSLCSCEEDGKENG